MEKLITESKAESIWLQITAGQGPKECGWVVARVYQTLVDEAQTRKLKVQMIEHLAFDKVLRKQDLILPDSFRSILLRVEGKGASRLADSWKGSIRWQGDSPYRKGHKRANWYVGIIEMPAPASVSREREQLRREVTMDTMRASGPGGQHVNKTNSAVRLTHLPTGLMVRADQDRSQHKNRQIAEDRLLLLLQNADRKDADTLERDRWLNHYQVERGNAKRTFKGEAFKPVT